MILALIGSLILSSSLGSPCTNFFSGTQKKIFANNFDWFSGLGMIVSNPRGMEKRSTLKFPENAEAFGWTSKYGSLSFNQVGVDFPNGGINEKGVTVGVMQLVESEYPEIPQGIPATNESQWVQMVLDLAGDVEEALALAKRVPVQKGFTGLHYFLCDQNKKCAIVEFVSGTMMIYENNTLPVSALTNSTYMDSLAALDKYGSLPKMLPGPLGPDSLARFIRTAFNVERVVDTQTAYAALRDVAQMGPKSVTQWSLVYDLDALQVTVKTLGNPVSSTYALRNINFDCQSGSHYTDITKRGPLAPLNSKVNESYLKRNFWLGKDSIQKIKESVVKYRRCSQFTDPTF